LALIIFDTGPIEVFSRNYMIFRQVMKILKDFYGDLLTTSENVREAKNKTPAGSLSKIVPSWITIENPSNAAKGAIRQVIANVKMGGLGPGELEAVALTLQKSRKIKPTQIVMVSDDERARPILDQVVDRYRCGKVCFTLEVLGDLLAYCSIQRHETLKLARYFQGLYRSSTFNRLMNQLEFLPKPL
jgi:predicted nucleic acid-binding protein